MYMVVVPLPVPSKPVFLPDWPPLDYTCKRLHHTGDDNKDDTKRTDTQEPARPNRHDGPERQYNKKHLDYQPGQGERDTFAHVHAQGEMHPAVFWQPQAQPAYVIVPMVPYSFGRSAVITQPSFSGRYVGLPSVYPCDEFHHGVTLGSPFVHPHRFPFAPYAVDNSVLGSGTILNEKVC